MVEDEPAPTPDARVVAALVQNHRQFLSFLEKRVGGRSEAEDILQDAFARGLEKLDSLRDDELAVAWFYRLLRNAVIDRARRLGTRAHQLEKFARELEATSEPDAEAQNTVCQCVATLADTLKPEYGEALRRIEIEGASVKEYAAQAGISENNAAVRAFRARAALRKQLAASCGTCADHGCFNCTCGTSACGGSP